MIVLFTMSVIGYNYIKYTQKNIKELSIKQLESIGHITFERLKEYLVQNQEKVQLFNSRFLLQKTLLSYMENSNQQQKDILRDILKLSYTEHGNIKDIIILDTDAEVIISKTNHQYIDKLMMQKMLTMSKKGVYSHLSFLEKEPLLCISAPIYKDEKFVGTTIFKFQLQALYKMLEQREGLDNTGEALLGTYNEDGDVILFTPLRFFNSLLIVSKDDGNIAVPMKTVLEKKEHFMIDDKLDYRRQKVVSTVYYFEPLNVGIVVKKDIKEILLPVEELKKELLKIAIVGLFIAILISCLFSAYIIRLIKHILDVTSKISNGNFSERIKIYTNDEVGMISKAVNKMANTLVGMNSELEKKVEEKTALLSDANNKLNYIFNITPNITIVTNGETIVKANNEFFKFTGFNNLEEFFKKYNCICDMFKDRIGYLKAKMQHESWVEYIVSHPNETHKVVIKKDKQEYMFLVNATAYLEKEKTNYIVVFENITEIQKIAHTDQLTKLANRLKIDEMLERCLQSGERYKRVFAIILIDVDFFKSVNDNHGHLVGDEVLKSVAKILNKLTRKVDFVGRWGGEEFIIVSKETNLDGAYAIGEKIRRAVESYTFSKELKLTVSIGISEYRDSKDTIDDLIKRADDGLYKAKEKGRNRVEVVK